MALSEYEAPQFYKHKQKHPRMGYYVRVRDCEVAEKLMGFIWIECSRREDFAGNKFSHILTAPENTYLTHILEPDTRVPNYSMYLPAAITVARKLGWETVSLFPTDQEMAAWICNTALQKEGYL